MRFHIIGLGSIGTLLAFHLRRALDPKHKLHLIHKTNGLAQTARSEGSLVRVEHHGATRSTTGFQQEGFDLIKEMPSAKGSSKVDYSIDSLFVTTKAHAAFPVIQKLLPRLSPKSTIVLMVNGMGVYEAIVNTLFRNPETRPQFILASNTHGAWMKNPWHIVHSGVGTLQFGIVPDPRQRHFEAAMADEREPAHNRNLSLDDIARPVGDPHAAQYMSLRNTVAALLNLSELNTEWHLMSQMQINMRRKLVANAVINPLTALLGCRNGEVFSHEAGVRIMQRVCQEAEEVFAAEIRSQPTIYRNAQGMQNDLIGLLPSVLKTRALMQNCLDVVKTTSSNLSSMLVDVRLGKKTEIDFLNGYLLSLGEAHKIQMCATATLSNLIKMRDAIPPAPL